MNQFMFANHAYVREIIAPIYVLPGWNWNYCNSIALIWIPQYSLFSTNPPTHSCVNKHQERPTADADTKKYTMLAAPKCNMWRIACPPPLTSPMPTPGKNSLTNFYNQRRNCDATRASGIYTQRYVNTLRTIIPYTTNRCQV